MVIHWGPAVIIMAVIFLASSTPSRDLPNFGWLDLLVKKGGHMLGYALLAVAYLRAAGSTDRRAYLLAFVGALLFAVSDEFHQSYTAGRHPSPLDVLVDSTGALLGLVATSRVKFLRRLVLLAI